MLAAEDQPAETSLGAFLGDIDTEDFEPLDREEEQRLVRRMNEEGDEEARKQLIQHNLRVAVREAKTYRHLGVPFEDVVSAAIKGLIIAVDSYQLGHGTKLISYARYAIHHRCRQAVARESGSVTHHASLTADAWRLRQARRRLKAEQGYVSDKDLKRELDWSQRKLDRVRKIHDRETRLDAPIDETEDGRDWHEVLPGAEDTAAPVDQEARREYLEQVMNRHLTKRERKILVLYFGLDGGEEMTLREVGELHGITLERTRQLRNRAFSKLEEAAGEELREILA